MAQKESSLWYFGEGAGLKFHNSNEKPEVLTDGAINAPEGCCTISDFEGNLLFYSNGENVWNKNHSIMKNGSGLSGNIYSTQSVLILPKPADPILYYVFTINSENEQVGLQYSIVDLSLDNGLGEVIQKNIPVFAPVAEKINAVRHKNGKDFWIITHELYSNRFLSFLLTREGLNSNPVISSAGLIYTGDKSISMGCLKVSPDGKKIACAVFSKFTFELFEFNNETGKIYNPKSIPTNESLNAYGCEFSPDGKKLYTTSFDSFVRLYQYDISSDDVNTIINSAKLLADIDAVNVLGSLQLAPDGKIYVAINKSPYIGCIQKPDEEGLKCNFDMYYISLGGKICRLGLPNIIYDYYNPEIPKITVSLPDTSAFVGDLITIPLKLKLLNKVQILSKKTLSFKATLCWDSRLLNITGVKGAIIKENRIEGNKSFLTIEGEKFEIKDEEIILSEISGIALLSNSRLNELLIDKFELSEEAIVNKVDGSLLLKGICQFDLNHLVAISQKNLRIFPNPSNGNFNIEILNFDSGINLIEIFDVEGRLVFYDIIAIFEGQKDVLIRNYDLNLTEGLYYLKIRNEREIFNDFMMIRK